MQPKWMTRDMTLLLLARIDIGAILQSINALLFFLFFRNMAPPEEKKLDAKSDESKTDVVE